HNSNMIVIYDTILYSNFYIFYIFFFFFFQAEDGIRDRNVTGVQTCALPICLTHGAMKYSYQPNAANRLIAAWQPTMKWQPQGQDSGRLRPLESTLDYRNPSRLWKSEWQSTFSNRMVFDTVVGGGGYTADYAPWRSKLAKPVVRSN